MALNESDDYTAGSLVFCHSKGFVGGSIRWCEKLRRDWAKTNEKTGAKYNHVAILDRIVDGEWTVIQAEGKGVTGGAELSSVAPGGSYAIVPLPAGVDQEKVLAFARSQVGYKYGFITVASIFLTLFTPRFINVMLPYTWICSAVGMESWRAGGFVHQWPDVYQVSPAQAWLAAEEKTS